MTHIKNSNIIVLHSLDEGLDGIHAAKKEILNGYSKMNLFLLATRQEYFRKYGGTKVKSWKAFLIEKCGPDIWHDWKMLLGQKLMQLHASSNFKCVFRKFDKIAIAEFGRLSPDYTDRLSRDIRHRIIKEVLTHATQPSIEQITAGFIRDMRYRYSPKKVSAPSNDKDNVHLVDQDSECELTFSCPQTMRVEDRVKHFRRLAKSAESAVVSSRRTKKVG